MRIQDKNLENRTHQIQNTRVSSKFGDAQQSSIKMSKKFIKVNDDSEKFEEKLLRWRREAENFGSDQNS